MARLPERLRKAEQQAELAIKTRQQALQNRAQPVSQPPPAAPVAITHLDQQPPQEEVTADPPSQVDEGPLALGIGAPEQREEPQFLEPAAPPAVDTAELERWRQRAQTSEGMLRAANQEKEAARQRAADLEKREQQLQAELDAERRRQPPKPMTREELLAWGFTEQELTDEGEDACRRQVELARKSASELVKPVEAKFQKELDAERVRSQAERAKNFWGSLKAVVSDYLVIDKDQRFRDWLDGKNDGDKRTRRDLANEAIAEADVERTAAIFNQWKKLNPAPKPKTPPESKVLPVGRPGAQRSLDPAPQETVSRAEIGAHNRRYGQDKRYRESPEALAMQQRIDRAVREKRIVD